MKILISGAGIAGPTLAYWLLAHGMEPVLVEEAPRLRTGGYIVDFWGAGFDVAEKMGLLPRLMERGYRVEALRLVDASGRRVGGFPADVFRDATEGRFVSLPRGELATAIYATVADRVETIFGDSIAALDKHARGVRVTWASGAEREFDLVVGADGLHSNVRSLAFEKQGETYLGYKVAAFEVAGYRPRDELIYVSYGEPGIQASRFSMRGDKTLIFLMFADADPEVPEDRRAQKQSLHERFGSGGWECPRMMATLDRADDLYLDRASQIYLPCWSRGRVALIGDAAACPSLLAGQGAALAMVAAYVLAGELSRSGGDHARAFTRYEALLKPFIEGKQHAARRLGPTFVPRSKFSIAVRNLISRAMVFPPMAHIVLGRTLRDDFALPDYG